MSYSSIDKLQKELSTTVFQGRRDPKKAAGCALGTIVEIITFYMLHSWGFKNSLAIERPLPEYGNSEITHNVEFSIHPIIGEIPKYIPKVEKPLSASKIIKAIWGKNRERDDGDKSNQLLSSKNILRNSCVITEAKAGLYVAHLDSFADGNATISVSLLHTHPFAIFECKRVGVEEGAKKGPTTIEKAKQGAYVARTVSSLQKVKLKGESLYGFIKPQAGPVICKPYKCLLEEIISSTGADLLSDFILTVGVVSNHGNWFTSENPGKELKVLKQSYDWLLFLTDNGLSDFISELILNPVSDSEPVRNAFLKSYEDGEGGNCFTKVQMDADANAVLIKYFLDNFPRITSWFNIISPEKGTLVQLRENLSILSKKNWKEIHKS